MRKAVKAGAVIAGSGRLIRGTVLAAALACGGLALGAGTIEGTATAPGPSISGTVVIVYTRVNAPAGARGPQTGAVSVAANGSFRITGLSAGEYALCVHGGGNDYLNLCRWSAQPPRVTLRTESETARATVQLVEGVRVRLNVKDPRALLARKGRPAAQGRVRPGIWMRNGLYLEIPKVAEDAAGEVYEVLAPEDESLHISITQTGVRLLDGAGRGLQRGPVSLAVVTKKGERRKTVELGTEEEPGR